MDENQDLETAIGQKTEIKTEDPIIVPRERLSSEALEGLIREFILREGTDYGVQEYSLSQKQAQVLRQLETGHAYIVFDPLEGTCSILRKEDLRKI